VAVGANVADTALDQSFEQPGARFSTPRAPLAVVDGDPLGGFEYLVGDDKRAVDRDPFLT